MQFGKSCKHFVSTILVVILQKFLNLRIFEASKDDRTKDIQELKNLENITLRF